MLTGKVAHWSCAGSPPTGNSATWTPRRGRVLVVEDNFINQRVSVLVLEKLGYRVDAVANGVEAIQLLLALPYDLVLMDCFMPLMDGFETTRALRSSENPRLRNVPVVALTASVAPDSRERCLAAGMNDCIPKPIQIDVIKVVLKRLLPEKRCVGIP